MHGNWTPCMHLMIQHPPGCGGCGNRRQVLVPEGFLRAQPGPATLRPDDLAGRPPLRQPARPPLRPALGISR